ncbi:DUF429 domain-containing protein [Salarchaeum japonicum]|uniref:DUF429 domain-containing protein n=1 Tax=Salarchaeum japonicum TaxID=555573 RepID=UPI003C73BDEB
MTVYGVDFSGAADAGAKIRVTEAEPTSNGIRVLDCWLAGERFGSSDREHVLPELGAFLAARSGEDAIGLDAPFALPRALHEHDDWRHFLLSFPGEFADPDDFRATCLDRARGLDGDRVERLRATDREHGALCAYGFILNTAAFHAMRDVLRPLVLSESIACPPFHAPRDDRPTLVEAYPAGTLDRLDAPRENYKTDTAASRARRETILDALTDAGVALAGVPRDRFLDDPTGDALDSALAALATARHHPDFAVDPVDPAEGHIFV